MLLIICVTSRELNDITCRSIVFPSSEVPVGFTLKLNLLALKGLEVLWHIARL